MTLYKQEYKESDGEDLLTSLLSEHLARECKDNKAKRDRVLSPTNKNSMRAEVANVILQVALTGFGTTILIHSRAKNLVKWQENMVGYYNKHLKSQPPEVQKLAGSVSISANFDNEGLIELSIHKNVVDIGVKDTSMHEKILNILESESMNSNEDKAYAILGMLYREGGIS